MARLSASTRLTYIGLWGLADDAGYLDWNPIEIAAALYRYQDRQYRDPRVATELTQLVEEGRVVVLACGRHAIVPTIPEHRIKGGETLLTIQKRHASRCDLEVTKEAYVVSASERETGTTEESVSVYVSDSVSDSDSVSSRARKASARSPAPMSPERAEAIIRDPDADEEAKAGARGYLELRQKWGKPAKTAGEGAAPA